MAKMGRPPRPADERFWARTRRADNGCIEWTGNLDRDGYGSFRPAGGRAVRTIRVHRWAYERFIDTIPDGLVIDHLCRNRACVNPQHLEPVTPRENYLRGDVNANKTHCINDHPLSGDNLLISSGKRACRTCRKAYAARYYQQKKAS